MPAETFRGGKGVPQTTSWNEVVSIGPWINWILRCIKWSAHFLTGVQDEPDLATKAEFTIDRERPRRNPVIFKEVLQLHFCTNFYLFLYHVCTTERPKTMDNCFEIAMEEKEWTNSYGNGFGNGKWISTKRTPGASSSAPASWWLWRCRVPA